MIPRLPLLWELLFAFSLMTSVAMTQAAVNASQGDGPLVSLVHPVLPVGIPESCFTREPSDSKQLLDCRTVLFCWVKEANDSFLLLDSSSSQNGTSKAPIPGGNIVDSATLNILIANYAMHRGFSSFADVTVATSTVPFHTPYDVDAMFDAFEDAGVSVASNETCLQILLPPMSLLDLRSGVAQSFRFDLSFAWLYQHGLQQLAAAERSSLSSYEVFVTSETEEDMAFTGVTAVHALLATLVTPLPLASPLPEAIIGLLVAQNGCTLSSLREPVLATSMWALVPFSGPTLPSFVSLWRCLAAVGAALGIHSLAYLVLAKAVYTQPQRRRVFHREHGHRDYDAGSAPE
jgi:hypothetical protein